jgi:hypothetical protein
MIDRTVRNAAAITVAVGSLLVAPFLSAVAVGNENARPEPTRIILVPSPVVSIVSVPAGRASDSKGHGHDQGHGHGNHHDNNNQGGNGND